MEKESFRLDKAPERGRPQILAKVNYDTPKKTLEFCKINHKKVLQNCQNVPKLSDLYAMLKAY
jgi:hypothetical protein